MTDEITVKIPFSSFIDSLPKFFDIVKRAANNSCCICCDECLACDAKELLKELGVSKDE